MAKAKLDILGRILSGSYTDWYILIEDVAEGDPKMAGADHYYVFLVKYNAPESDLVDVPDAWLGYDSYYTSWEQVELNVARMEIEWLEGEEIFFGHRYYYKNNPRS
ncbi:MAG: hypothetical protein FWC91_06310 [Defluviitaleaceae bacterium]|nr:hypothetical protein [Defluviitaleaceae bacterium]